MFQLGLDLGRGTLLFNFSWVRVWVGIFQFG